MAGLRIVVAEGDAHARGRAVGAALGDLIAGSLAFHGDRLSAHGVHPPALERLLGPHLDAARQMLPRPLAQLEGMAEGAEADFWQLFAVNALEELEPALDRAQALGERCSTFAAAAPAATLLGHNEQWYAGDLPNVAVVVERPVDGPACVSPTVACYLPAVGMNGHGAAQGVDSLAASDDGVGVPRVLVSRHALDASDRGDALARASVGGRAGGYAHVFAFAGGDTVTVETTARRAAVLSGPRSHANHYLDPGLAALAAPPSASSTGRQERLDELLAERAPERAEDAMALLADHAAQPDAICLHPDEADGDEAWGVLFSMVCDVDARRMWVAPGNPCVTPYEEVDLGDVL